MDMYRMHGAAAMLSDEVWHSDDAPYDLGLRARETGKSGSFRDGGTSSDSAGSRTGRTATQELAADRRASVVRVGRCDDFF